MVFNGEEIILNLEELKPVIAKEEYCVQNGSASDPMSVPSSLLWALTHRVTSPNEELFPASSLLVDSGEELADLRNGELLFVGMSQHSVGKAEAGSKWGRDLTTGKKEGCQSDGLVLFGLPPQC